MSSLSDFNVGPTLIGSLTETAPVSDTASSGLNGRLQRIAQRLTSLIALIPAALGQGTKAQSMSVTLASNDDLVSTVGVKTDAANTATNTTSVSAMSVWKQISASIQTLATMGQQLKSASRSITLASDDDLLAKVGEVQASPTSNTVLDRLKALLTGIVLAAGTNEIGKTNVKHFNVTGSTLTRPANTTAYAANDSVSDNATAGSVTAQTVTVSDTNDNPVDLLEVLLTSTDTGFGNVSMRLHVFESDPTASSGVGAGDNAAYSQKQAGWVGSFTGTMIAFSDGSRGVLIPDGPTVKIANVESGGKRLWWQLQVLGGATPSANSTTFIPRFKGYQGRV